jgi:hypothetical protein
MSGWTSPGTSMTRRRRIVYTAIIMAAFLVGLLTMTDPAPEHPQPEGSPDVTGSVDVPEVSPIGPS